MEFTINQNQYSFHNSQGKEVKVFLPENEVDKETMKQIKNLVEKPTVNNPRFMPDTHKGHGGCVGFTSLIKEGLHPRYVGGDIGCGISCYPLGVQLREKSYPSIEKKIRAVVPMGNGENNINVVEKATEDDWETLFQKCNQRVQHLYSVFPNYYQIEYNMEWYQNLCQKIKSKVKHNNYSLGSLGGGNHYVEINKDEQNYAYVTVHSGSRNLGQKVCRFHQLVVNRQTKFNWDLFEKRTRKECKIIKGKENKKKVEDQIYQEMKSNLSKPYLEGVKMYDYLIDMIFTQQYASLNRKIMLREISNIMGYQLEGKTIIETVHNYIDITRMILRKGAVSAEKDKLCIISLNMKEGILLCKGKGNPDWNYSSAHGCGRILTRSQGSRLNLKRFKQEMEDVYSTSVVKETLDESPMAYRNSDLVKKCLYNSVEIIQQLKPVINVKGI